MSELMRALASVLGPAVDTARTTLRDLDQDEVPAKLRKVSASSARSLTPPLTKALLRELDANDWFRAKVIETWERDEGGDDISDAYLRRTEGWWLTIAGATGVSLSGDRFYYPNPLETARGKKRVEWFGCPCCPPNVVRFFPIFRAMPKTSFLNQVASDILI